jgi:hypothetical protein
MDRNLRMKFGAICAVVCVLCAPQRGFGQKGLPDGKGKEEFVHNCTACHRADMVTRVKKTPEDWRKSVDEMASRGTDGSKEDLDNAYVYLVTNYAKDKSDTSPAAQAAPPAAGPGGAARLDQSGVERLMRLSAEGDLVANRWGSKSAGGSLR